MPYELNLADGTKVDLKADGSIDLESKYKKGFDFQFDIKAPNVTDGTVVYKFWTTNGRGDFRDDSKRRELEVSTITLKYGDATDAAKIKSFSATQLFSPTADGKSETFISLFDGKTYKINEGVEYAAFGDFGFHYDATFKTSLYSTNAYPLHIFTEENMTSVIAAIEAAGINKTYFKLTGKDKAFFDAVTLSDLNTIIKTETQSIKYLKVGDVVEFVDNYGKKGYIYIVNINPTMGIKGFIEIEVKMEA